MNIRIKDLKYLDQKGVYALYNLKNKKVYIGSTSKSFKERIIQHERDLNNQKHFNNYLQKAWNKQKVYFEFRILMITESNLEWEQKFINYYKPFKIRGYNLNKIASCPPNKLSKEVVLRRTETNKQTQKLGSYYYFKVKNEEMLLKDVPNKYLGIVNFRLRTVPWNKGIKLSEEFRNKLSIAASNREFTEEGTKRRKEAFIKISSKIAVYKEEKLLKIYNYIDDIIEDDFLKDYISEFRARRGKFLRRPNIYASCRTGKPYKGLSFQFVPS
jgi:hypothetical protein